MKLHIGLEFVLNQVIATREDFEEINFKLLVYEEIAETCGKMKFFIDAKEKVMVEMV